MLCFFCIVSLLVSFPLIAQESNISSGECDWTDSSSINSMQKIVQFGLIVGEYYHLESDSGQLVKSVSRTDAPRKFIGWDSISDVPMFGEPIPQSDTLAKDIHVTLLAWQHIKAEEEELYTVLGYAEYKDSVNVQGWALISLVAPSSRKHWEARCWFDKPVQHYNYPPTNKDVYTFLDSLSCVECRMFIFDKKGKYDWNGVEVTLVDGQICEEAWEEKIGEKPKKKFPKVKK